MPVTIFHIASKPAWEEARSRGAYHAPNPSTEGFIHCSTSDQIPGVANALFRNEGELALLCIDPGRLNSEVRYEAFEPGSPSYPHIYGPINLDAVVAVHGFQPGKDGIFRFPSEAKRLVVREATTEDIALRSRSIMGDFNGPWWVAGGWAIDLLLGRTRRKHSDLDIAIRRTDQAALYDCLRWWDLRIAHEGKLQVWRRESLELPFHVLWGRLAEAEEAETFDVPAFSADPTFAEFVLLETSGDQWVFRRDPRVQRPFAEIAHETSDGVPFLRPEVILLFKAKAKRESDEADFRDALPTMNDEARE
jgi:uncharacterized protein (DUF952 family)